MKAEDFEDLYQQVRPEAERIARAVCGDDAGDVVQETALYFWERLASYTRVTPSLFKEITRKNAMNRTPRPHGKSSLRYEFAAGGEHDLAVAEEEEAERQGGRVPPAPRAE